MSESDQSHGLRGRKRLATMRRVQEVALDLFDQDGYGGVTIERIAGATDVSPSSVYRYFGTKEQIVLWDDAEHRWKAAVVGLADLAPPEAIHHAIASLVAASMLRDLPAIRRRVRCMMTEPSIEAASALRAHQTAEVFGTALSEGLGRPHGDLEIQMFSHAVVGAIVGAVHHWYESNFTAPLNEIVDRLLLSFEEGFALTEGGRAGAGSAGHHRSGLGR